MANKKKTTKSSKAAKRGPATPAGDAKPRLSCLDAAARVLADATEPMRVRAIVDAMRAKGLWSSDAATPHATLYSAMLREITTKRGKSRFRKAGRGQFVFNG